MYEDCSDHPAAPGCCSSCNCVLLAAMSAAARRGEPGMESHPDYVRVSS